MTWHVDTHSFQQSIKDAVASAKHLQTLRLHVHWIPKVWSSSEYVFTVEEATKFMLRTEDSQLRAIAIGGALYTVRFLLSLLTCRVLDTAPPGEMGPRRI